MNCWSDTVPGVMWSDLRGIGNHCVESHFPLREVPNRFHVGNRHTVRLPLRHGAVRNLEMGSEGGTAALLAFEPVGDVHAYSLGESKPFRQGNPKCDLFSIGLPMENARRRRFAAYFSGKPFNGDRAKLIAKTGLTSGRITQLLDEDEVFGERAAAALAVRLGLAPDYFERDHGESESLTLAPEEVAMILAWRQQRLVASAPVATALPARDKSEHLGGNGNQLVKTSMQKRGSHPKTKKNFG